MGLFSKLFKNKQESAGEDSGFYVPGEAQAPGRKRAANTSGGSSRRSRDAADPALPEKKRARRRLIGAIALALGVAVGLPMLLDSEPKAPINDIGIEIPSKDKVAASAAPAQASVPPAASNNGLDQSEEIVDTPMPAKPKPAAAAPAPVLAAAEPAPAKPYTEPQPEPKPVQKPEPKPEPKPVQKPEPKPKPVEVVSKPEHKPEPKPEPKHESKPESKPAKPAQSTDDAARALAILEGKPSAKPAAEKAPEKAADSDGRFVVQVAALATQEKVDELQAKLSSAGIRSYTQKVSSAGGERIRVRVGPFGSREEAEKTRAKLQKLGLGGSLVPA
ncbi:SPOR domain-containing protein [Janthinobacterium aquaticum]|uniref:SPOR domain-containing protein n=1 Tax=Janthinobacterium sp. FT58W TaxID=2654254 RepID=UPI001265540E|nr:SPOR domain-containing protein [Janthinobacterium sp. FT58W]KAB8041763.1 SPOR domain-containing protein [Janthinobacterium sp. FT58W]